MDVVKWLTETAKFIHKDRPDVFKSFEDSFEILSMAYDSMVNQEGPGWTAFGGFILYKHVEEDNSIEFNLAKKISSVDLFPQDKVCHVTGWTEGSGTLKSGVDLPSPML